MATGVLPLTIALITGAYAYILLGIVVAFFAWLFISGTWTPVERKRLYIITIYFIAAALFWSVFEQAGSTLNLFADRSTNNQIFNYTFPSSWWQSVNAILIFILAPGFAWLWVTLGKNQPASPSKFGFGLVCVGLGFLILMPAALSAEGGAKVGVIWLFLVYLIHTIGELCLSPVGLSSMTKLAPTRIVSLMMGVWFLGASVGNFLGGKAASFYEAMPLHTLLLAVAVLPILAGVLMLVNRKTLTAMMGGVE
jgi:POT family proton-dependent oligopeptide transporter